MQNTPYTTELSDGALKDIIRNDTVGIERLRVAVLAAIAEDARTSEAEQEDAERWDGLS